MAGIGDENPPPAGIFFDREFCGGMTGGIKSGDGRGGGCSQLDCRVAVGMAQEQTRALGRPLEQRLGDLVRTEDQQAGALQLCGLGCAGHRIRGNDLDEPPDRLQLLFQGFELGPQFPDFLCWFILHQHCFPMGLTLKQHRNEKQFPEPRIACGRRLHGGLLLRAGNGNESGKMFRANCFLAVGAALAVQFTAPAQQLSTSKLSAHLINDYTVGSSNIVYGRPVVLKVLGLDSWWPGGMVSAMRDYKLKAPGGKIVARIYSPREYSLNENATAAAGDFWTNILARSLNTLTPADRALIDYLEGPNEGQTPTLGYPPESALQASHWFNEFWTNLTPRIVAAGFKPCIGSIAVGNPGGDMQAHLSAFVPALRQAKAAGDPGVTIPTPFNTRPIQVLSIGIRFVTGSFTSFLQRITLICRTCRSY
jgi:hypothetical protein